MTFLDLLNKVLRRLREDTVNTMDGTEYSRLVSEFIAEIHQECVEVHDWTSMRHTINLAVANGTRTYNLGKTIANGGNVPNTERVTTTDSLLVYDQYNQPMAFLFDSDSDTQGNRMIPISQTNMERLYQSNRALTNTEPNYFSYRLHPSNDGLELTLWPIPATTRTARLTFWTPEEEPTTEGTDDNTALLVPWKPVYLGTLMLALNERGEEMGEPGNIAERRYYNSLARAIEADQQLGGRTNQQEFVRD